MPGRRSTVEAGDGLVAGLYRAATAVRQHLENTALRAAGLTWTSFGVLRVLLDGGQLESRHVAAAAGIAKGTLTGVVRTLEARGLLARIEHPDDGRLLLLALTGDGVELMRDLVPRFAAEEAFVSAGLSDAECGLVAAGLRQMVRQVQTCGEQRRLELLAGAPPARRRSGRRPGA
ncbi:MarR family transcriptional regulator [Dactylosporangium vinaceum]|uniref:MarR family winged helix-turn-helix transcriptional regulator n=1 Tax=Dactylosporangium vinaceum TaxID=53362 RepID=A0ABV5MMR5_9ACTN|nr:MarR family transcriptional regulator [Dactylosporangium vinaceum]UAB92267.1 MarR family transcriptional regulator [Dactylosporangium vinaceum]